MVAFHLRRDLCARLRSDVLVDVRSGGRGDVRRNVLTMQALGALALASLLPAWLPSSALRAEPVVCVTTTEAPLAPRPGGGLAAPVEVSRCGAVQSSADLLEKRFYAYTAPYARGVDITHQITDVLGLAMGGGDGTRLMGLGFPEQTITWDGSAVESATEALLQRQSTPIPWRTADLPNGYGAMEQVDGRDGRPGAIAPGQPLRGWR